jgi:hypothetical protein
MVSLFKKILLAYFAIKITAFTFILPPGVGTDEIFHLQFVDFFSKSPLLYPFGASNSYFSQPLEEYARFGPTVRFPLLYHLLLGKITRVLHLNPLEFETIIFIRLFSVAFALLHIRYFLKLIALSGISGLAGLVAIAAHTNLFMFTIISSSISYDPLLNLFATASLYHLILFVQSKKLNNFLLLCLFSILGTWTKASFLPLIPIFAAVFISANPSILKTPISYKALSSFFFIKFPLRQKKCFSLNITQLALLCLILCSGYFTFEVYYSNFAKYSSLVPSCDQVFTPKICRQNKFYVHDLKTKLTAKTGERVSIFKYIGVWFFNMMEGTLGLYAYRVIRYPETIIYLALALLGTSYSIFTLTILRNKAKTSIEHLKIPTYFAIISCSYAIFILFSWNYVDFCLYSTTVGFGVNGRYVFPVLSSICIIFGCGIIEGLNNKKSKIAATAIMLSILTFQELPYLITQDAFRQSIEKRGEQFYKNLPYYPNPVYNKHKELSEIVNLL